VKLALHQDILGTTHHLIYDGNNFSWHDLIPDDIWVFGDRQCNKSLDLVCDAVDSTISFPSAAYKSMFSCITNNNSNFKIKWHMAMKNSHFKEEISTVLERLWEVLTDNNGSYYINEFLVIRKLLQSLSAAKIDVSELNRLASNEKTTSLKSFTPVSGSDYAQIPAYDQTKTVTGRLTIASGPGILTLKKEYRKILTSRYPDGKIVQIDFVSLEPRVLLTFLEKECPRDIYTHIASTVFKDKIDRATTKILTLSVLYGLSSKNLANKLEINIVEARHLYKKIKDYFEITDTTKMLVQSASHGKIKNIYKRHINISRDPNYVILNRFVQSSAADAALLAFSSMIEKMKSLTNEIHHIFIIHDAILLDVSQKGLNILKTTIGDSMHVPKFNKKFPIDYTIVS